MADAQRGQFVIDCKSGEQTDIIYGWCIRLSKRQGG